METRRFCVQMLTCGEICGVGAVPVPTRRAKRSGAARVGRETSGSGWGLMRFFGLYKD